MNANVTKTVPQVLLVDDEPGIRRMFRAALGNYGFDFEEASDAAWALALLARRPFDVVVTDINMPGSGGLDLLRAARDRAHDVPIIVVTGKPTAAGAKQAAEFGAFRYLIKPVMPTTLRDAIVSALAGRAAAQ